MSGECAKVPKGLWCVCISWLVNCLECCVDKSPEFSGKEDCDGLVMSPMGTGREVTCLTIS